MYREHPRINTPPSDAVLWRYMDFTKYVSLLDKNCLFFARADLLGDPFEGSLSPENHRRRPELYPDASIVPELGRFFSELRYSTYISCWHLSDYESASMWRLYAKNASGVAIRTECGHMQASLQSGLDIHIGTVTYIDYKSMFIPEDNMLEPYLFKRQEFAHEQEVRAIFSPYYEHDTTIDMSPRPARLGVYVRVDPSILIQEIVIAPYSQKWFIDLVGSVANRYGLGDRVTPSSLSEEPTW